MLVDFLKHQTIFVNFMEYSSEKSKKAHQAAEKKSAHNKMVMIEQAMHGKKAGKRESKNYRGKDCSKCRK